MNTSLNPEKESNLRRIERVSVFLRGFCTGLVVPVAVVAVVAAVAVAAGRITSVNSFGTTIPIADLRTGGRVAVAVLGLVTGAVIVKALFHLRRLADNYSRREIFTADSSRQIRQFGVSCVLWGVVKIVWALMPVMLRSHGPAALGVTVDSVLIGGVIVVMSWFAEMATALREENDLTI